MSTLNQHIEHSLLKKSLLTLYGLTEADVQSTSVKGFPVSGQPTQQPSSVAVSRTPDSFVPPVEDENQPANDNHLPDEPAPLDTEAGQEVSGSDGENHVEAETEFFSSLQDILGSFQGYMSSCQGTQYDNINAAVETLKQTLMSHLASYSETTTTAPPVEQTPATPIAADVTESWRRRLVEQRGEFFDSQLHENNTVFYIGPGASESSASEASGDYIWFADLQGDSNYIELVVRERIVEELDAPRMTDIGRKLKPAIIRWLKAAGAPDNPKVISEVDLIVLAYTQEVIRHERNNRINSR